MRRLKLWLHVLFGVWVILMSIVPFIIGFLLDPIIIGFKCGRKAMDKSVDKVEHTIKNR